MFYKRPSLRMGGMPTGIDSLTPRVQANEGFLGNRDMFFLPSNLKNLQNQRFNVGTSGGVITSNAQKMRSFPMDASEMGVASIRSVEDLPASSSSTIGKKKRSDSNLALIEAAGPDQEFITILKKKMKIKTRELALLVKEQNLRKVKLIWMRYLMIFLKKLRVREILNKEF